MRKIALLLAMASCSTSGPDVRSTEQPTTVPRQWTYYAIYGYPAPVAGATQWQDGSEGSVYFGGGAWDVPLTMDAGRSFSSITGTVYDWTGAKQTVQLVSTTRGVLGSARTAGSTGGPTSYSITLACSPCVALAGEQLAVRFTPDDSAEHRVDPIQVASRSVVIDGPIMGLLPDARTITLNPGDAIPATLIDEIMDVIIAEHASRVATRTRSALIGLTGPAGSTPIDIPLPFGGYQVQLPVTVGETIVDARAMIRDSATGPTKFFLTLAHNDPTVSTLPVADTTGPQSAGTGALQTIHLTPYASGGSVPVVSGRTYYIYFTCSTGVTSGHLYLLEYDVIPST